MLDLRRLAVFREVAERGSFSDAAAALDYTQSAVSHHVARLESELGMSLFERGRRPVRLTPAGERMREHAGALIGAAAAAEDEMRSLAGLETGLVRVGAFLSACTTFMPNAIGRFAAKHPSVEVRLDQEEPPVAVPRLIAGELDLAVVYRERAEPSQPDPRLESVALGDDAYRIVLHPQHRLARRRTVGFGDLEGERFAAPRAAGGGIKYRAMVERLCSDEGFAPNMAYAVDDVTVARAFVAAGLAVGVMPDMTIGHPRSDVVVKPIKGMEPFRTIEACWVRGRRAAGIAPMVDALRASI
jgi:DNA-binding transcriptional LysR family regulator